MKRKQVVCTNVNTVSDVSEMSRLAWHCYFFLLTKGLPLAYKGASGMNQGPRNNMGGLFHLEREDSLLFFQGLKLINGFWHIAYIHKPTVFTSRYLDKIFCIVKKIAII